MERAGPRYIGVALLAGWAVALLVCEHRRPLRQTTQAKLPRQLRNAAMAAVSAAVMSLLERPVIVPLARWVAARRIGLVQRLGLPPAARGLLGLVLMDYTLYLWHVLMHRSPALWRLHLPHHADLDLDVSTAVRFHPAELAASVPWRVLQILAIGVGPRTLSAWQMWTLGCIVFHHSNLRIPEGLERRIAWVLTTPRMHGIHHSTVRTERDSNWSSGLSVWDRLHGTLRVDRPQSALVVGVPAYRDARELGLIEILSLPFQRQRPSWIDAQGRRRGRGAALELVKERR